MEEENQMFGLHEKGQRKKAGGKFKEALVKFYQARNLFAKLSQ